MTMDVRITARCLITAFAYFNVIYFTECEPSFAFEPQSIWHGNLRHIEFNAEPLLCADKNWNFKNAQLTCRSLGFSDAMMYTSESNEQEPDEKLVECIFETATNIKCETISSSDCNEVAWLACQLPGFEGCYSSVNPSGYIQQSLTDGVTIQNCLSSCRLNGYTYVALSNGNNCYCSNELPRSTRVAASNCNTPCEGDSGQACGGRAYSAVYNSILGSCEGSLTSEVGFITSPGFPGDTISGADSCNWHFETSYFNRTLIRVIGAVFEGGSQLGLEFETVEIDSRSYIENDVTFTIDTEGAQSGTIWRTDEPITKEARNNMVQKNMTVRYTSRRSNAKWFILKFEVEQVDFEIMTSTIPPSTPNNKASSCFSLSSMVTVLIAVLSCFI